MNRNRRDGAHDATMRMIHREANQSDAPAWLRTLRQLRALPEVAT